MRYQTTSSEAGSGGFLDNPLARCFIPFISIASPSIARNQKVYNRCFPELESYHLGTSRAAEIAAKALIITVDPYLHIHKTNQDFPSGPQETGGTSSAPYTSAKRILLPLILNSIHQITHQLRREQMCHPRNHPIRTRAHPGR